MPRSRIGWLGPEDPPDAFPPIQSALAEPNGLLAAGGDLATPRLLSAYRNGIFPWYEEGQPILWWSPDPRCVLKPGAFHVARRLRRDLSKSSAVLTINRSFSDVVHACAAPRRGQHGTWITNDMMSAYKRLHAEGWAHSVEIRDGGQLIGGVYGLAIGRVFFGESMFSLGANASKMALLGLCNILDENDFELIDCQVVSPHLQSLGAETLPRAKFAAVLDSACNPETAFDDWPTDAMPVAELTPK